MPGTLTTPRDQTCPAQRTGQQPASVRKTTSISSQNRMLRITVVRLLAGIVNRTTMISKQKMYPLWGMGYWVMGIQFIAGWGRKSRTPQDKKIPLSSLFTKGGQRGICLIRLFSSLRPRPWSLPALPPVTGHRSLTTICPGWQWHRSRSAPPDSPAPSRQRPLRRENRS